MRLPASAPKLARAWLLGVFKLGTYWSCYTWLPSFLAKEMGQGVGRSLTWMLTAQAGQLAGMLSFGQVADRVGRRPAFTIYSLGDGISDRAARVRVAMARTFTPRCSGGRC